MCTNKIDTKAAALYLGFKTNTLEIWRKKNKGPKFARMGGAIRYDINDLEAYFQAHCVHTRDSAPQLRKKK